MNRSAPERPRARSLIGAVALALALTGACANSGDGADRSDSSGTGGDALSGVVVTPTPDVSSLTLPEATASATAFPFRADADGVLLVYFGYTACPDVCPTTLSDLKVALRRLGGPADRVDVAMATIDPRRDTADVISRYLHSFFPDATALRTDDDAALRAVTDAFGASYLTEYPTQGEPKVSHSAYLYVVDDAGRVVLSWPFGTTSDDIAHDLGVLLT